MAGYRPKSLDELNSLYDKSVNVKNEIDKKASDLEVKQEIYIPAPPVLPEEEITEAVSREENEAGEISGLVDDFIKNFGAPAPAKKARPVAPTTLKAVSSAKSEEPKAPVRQSSPVAPVVQAASDKPRLIRNSERNDLFENYKKVMDDEDEEDFSRHRLGRKRSKKRSEKKSAAPENVQQTAEAEITAAAEENVAETELEAAEAFIVPAEEEIPETLENIDAVIEKVLGKSVEKSAQDERPEGAEEFFAEAEQTEGAEEAEATSTDSKEIDEASEEAAEISEAELPEEASYEISEEEPEVLYEATTEEKAETPEAEEEEAIGAYAEETAKKSFAGKNILLCVLLLVLLLATAVSAVKAFAGINSDSLVLSKYHLYTATENYAQARIKKGDLVVILNEGIKEGDIFAFKKGDGEYSFAELEGVLNADSIIADKDGQKSIVFKNTLRGVFYKTYPAIGTFAALVASYYLYIIGGLLLAAAVLVLIIAIAFRKRKEKADEVQESYYEDEQTDVQESSENPEYEAVEGDFRYLIEDESEDEFDIYRKDYEEADGEEGLPVYAPEDYKYEPDEYVNN